MCPSQSHFLYLFTSATCFVLYGPIVSDYRFFLLPLSTESQEYIWHLFMKVWGLFSFTFVKHHVSDPYSKTDLTFDESTVPPYLVVCVRLVMTWISYLRWNLGKSSDQLTPSEKVHIWRPCIYLFISMHEIANQFHLQTARSGSG